MRIRLIYICLCLFTLWSCIKNDVPYPYIPGNILEMKVEGQTGAAEINAGERTVRITVDDRVDLENLKILKLKTSDYTALFPDSTACVRYVKFPRMGFDSLNALPSSANTCMRFSRPVIFLLQTYQDYLWTVRVKQVIDRVIRVQNQVGKAVVDEQNRMVLIYVASDQPLNTIQIEELTLGGAEATILPDPTTVHNFFRPQKFIVCRLGKYFEEWTVDVVQTASIGSTGEADVWARHATVVGGIKQGLTPGVEYRKEGETTWTTLAADAIRMTGATAFEAKITGLEDGTTYTWRIAVAGQTSGEASFTTEKISLVPNLNFDTWIQNGKNWYPNPVADNNKDPQAYWATGNEGVTSPLAGGKEANTTPVTEAVKGKAVRMVTLGKINLVGAAAGNLFVGTYKTNMTSPSKSVSFGRPFSGARPTGFKGWYRYKSMPIDYIGHPEDLKNDQCHIYVRLWDGGDNLIGQGEFIGSKTVTAYTQFGFDIIYTNPKARPAKMTIVATSSRYGGDFTDAKVTGSVGIGSELFVDEFELLYD
ncbi:MAG: PCMD domain-containing protein [Odoribacter sp.]